jgi:hypothetical protein
MLYSKILLCTLQLIKDKNLSIYIMDFFCNMLNADRFMNEIFGKFPRRQLTKLSNWFSQNRIQQVGSFKFSKLIHFKTILKE